MTNNFIHIPQMQTAFPFESKYPVRVGAVVDWPTLIKYKDKVYWSKNQHATSNETGMPCSLYQIGENRIWVYLDGHIEED